jgi:SAM-dependent methyltransferase
MMQATASDDDLVCPACLGAVRRAETAFRCPACDREFPILHGIPDFRLRSDAYLSLEEERAKAARLADHGRTSDFRGLVAYYYEITDDVPPHLAPRFAAYVTGGVDRAALPLARLGADPEAGRLLDLGCGSGAALVASQTLYAERTGVDIALRWLVIAAKRLEEQGVAARLICADAEALPFRPESFTHVLADDLVDNVRSADEVLGNVARCLADDGRLWLSVTNDRWIGPHPATGLWAAGLLPTALRSRLLLKRHGIDLLRNVALLSPVRLSLSAASVGLRLIRAAPREIALAPLSQRPFPARAAANLYQFATHVPLLRTLMRAFGPVIEQLYVRAPRPTGGR